MNGISTVLTGAAVLGLGGLAIFAWPPAESAAPADATAIEKGAETSRTRSAEQSEVRQADSRRSEFEAKEASARRAVTAEQSAQREAFQEDLEEGFELATELVEAKRLRDPESPESMTKYESIRSRYRTVRSRLIRRVDRDRGLADLFYEEISEVEDGDVQRELAQILPFVTSEAFGRKLAAAAIGGPDATTREVAMIGLRGRGATGADAVIEVAETTTDPVERSVALRELRAHLGDPRAIRSARRGFSVVERHLYDDDVEVRRSAVITLGTMRAEPSSSMRERVQQIAESDPDEDLRLTARSLLTRWG